MLRPTAKEVIAKEDYVLDIKFDNGERKLFDVKPYIQGEWYGKLKDSAYFKAVAVDGFTVVWPDGQDICPDELYENSKSVELHMIPRIKSVKPLENYILEIVFDDGKEVLYDMNDDIDTLPGYDDLKSVPYLFKQVALDESRTWVYWTDDIDLPSDMLYEYGKVVG